MKKVTLFCEGLHNRAGIERMTVELANLLVNHYLVEIIVIDPFSAETCPYEINKKVKVTSLNASFKKRIWNLNWQLIKSLRKLLIENQTDSLITVATPLVRISAPATRGLGIKNIAWEHFNVHAGSKLGCLFKIAASWMADMTVVLTEADAKSFRALHGRNIVSIPNFTSIGDNEPSKCENKVLLAVGRHEPQKGFDMLIKAWANVDIPGWKLRIVGDGSQKEANKQLANDLGVSGTIDFADSTPHIAEEFQNASCFVLSSRFEGLVLVLIEAKMMGLPCISFDCPESPREIIHDGIDGVLVPPGNIDSMSKAIINTLNNPDKLRVMGSKARKDATHRYSPDHVINKWIEIL